MPEYIDREKAIEYVMSRSPFINGMTSLVCIERAIKNVPIADVVKVVRCKDCKHAYINSFSAQSGVALCRFWTNRAEGIQAVMQQDDYCSYGERKE